MRFFRRTTARVALALLAALVLAAGLPAHAQQDTGLDNAIQAFRSADLVRAQSLLSDYLAAHPRSPAAWNLQGLIADSQKRFAEGERAFRKALELQPSASVYNNLGNHLLLVDQPEEAAQSFRKALELDPRHFSSRYNLISLLLAGKGCSAAAPPAAPVTCPQESLGLFAGFSSAERKSPDVVTLHVRALLASGEETQALGEARSALGAPGGARQFALMLATEFRKAGHAPDGVGLLEQAISQEPRLRQDFDFHLSLALAKSQAGQPAQEDFLELAKMRPGAWQPYYYLGREAATAKQYLQASRWLVKAEKLAPEEPRIAAALASTASAQGFWLDAADEWQRYLRLKPDDPRAYRELAIAATMGKQRDLGLESMQRYLAAFPNDAEARYMLALMEQDAGRQEDARQAMQKSLELKPDNAPAWTSLGRLAMSENHLDDAQKDFQRALELAPRDVATLVALAELYARQGRPELAQPLLEQAITLDPKNIAAHYQLVQVYRRTGHKTRAAEEAKTFERLRALGTSTTGGRGLLSYLRADVGLPPAAQRQHYREFLENALVSHPDDPRVLVRLGIAELQAGQTTEAVTRFQQALAQPSLAYTDALSAAQVLEAAGKPAVALQFYGRALAAPEATTDARAALGRARLLAREGKTPEALQVVYAVPVEAEPKGEAAALAAEIYARQNDDVRALAAYQVALGLAPDNETIVRNAALFLASREHWQEALRVLDEATARVPASTSLKIYKAVLLQLSGHQAEAQTVLASLAFHGDDPALTPDERLAGLLLAISYYTSDQKEPAARLLEELTQADPGLALAWYYRALIASEGGQPARALEWASRAVALDASYTPALYLRGKLLMESGRLTDAARDLQAAARADPAWSPPHYLLARLYRRRGDGARADQEQKLSDQLGAETEQQASPSGALRAYLKQLAAAHGEH